MHVVETIVGWTRHGGAFMSDSNIISEDRRD